MLLSDASAIRQVSASVRRWTTAAQRSRLTAAVRNAVEAEKIFVLANVGLVKSVARKQSQKRALSVTYEDMEQAGYVGLLVGSNSELGLMFI